MIDRPGPAYKMLHTSAAMPNACVYLCPKSFLTSASNPLEDHGDQGSYEACNPAGHRQLRHRAGRCAAGKVLYRLSVLRLFQYGCARDTKRLNCNWLWQVIVFDDKGALVVHSTQKHDNCVLLLSTPDYLAHG